MAKVTIVIEDKINDEGKKIVGINIDSDPPFDMVNENLNTTAQHAALVASDAIREFFTDNTDNAEDTDDDDKEDDNV